MKRILYFLSIGIFVTGCQANLDKFEPSAGEANFETIVFVGNSLTAGYRDGALFPSGQNESFATIIHRQLYNAGLNNKPFKIPYMKDEAGLGGRRIMGIATDCRNQQSLAPVPYPSEPNLTVNLQNISNEGPFNNMGVPGARLPHLFFAGYATLNPYYGRMASSIQRTIIQDVAAQSPTFVFTWIGNNDVLGYAIAGGEGDTITSTAFFSQLLFLYFNSVYTGDTKGAICNIPPITVAPFFTTIKPNDLVLDTATAQVLNGAYVTYNGAAQQLNLPQITFSAGRNYFVIQDVNHPLGRRQIKSSELLLLTLPQDSLKCAYWGTQNPIPSKYVLDTFEIAQINAAIANFNQAIAQRAEAKGIPVIDIHNFLKEIYTSGGIRIEGQTFTTAFVTGQIFSLDGIHLTGKGNAIVANKIIEEINRYYKANIPKAMVQEFTGNVFP